MCCPPTEPKVPSTAKGASKFTCLVLFILVPVFYFQVPQSPHVWCWHQVPLRFLLSVAWGLHVSNKMRTSYIFTANCFFLYNFYTSLSFSKMLNLTKSFHQISNTSTPTRWGRGIYAGTLLLYAQVSSLHRIRPMKSLHEGNCHQ